MSRLTRLAAVAVAAVALTACSSGSMRKIATITSDPPCAQVWMNGVYRGETPVEIPYNWNWFYDFRLEKAGYEPFNIRERFYTSPQHMAPLDLVSELSPVRVNESQWRHYTLTPKREP